MEGSPAARQPSWAVTRTDVLVLWTVLATVLALLVSTAATAAPAKAADADLRAGDLHTEYAVNPLGIDATEPRLS